MSPEAIEARRVYQREWRKKRREYLKLYRKNWYENNKWRTKMYKENYWTKKAALIQEEKNANHC